MSAGSRLAEPALGAVRDGWRLLLALALVGGLAGFGWGLAEEPEYAATASVIVLDRGELVESVGAGAVGGSGPAATERLLEIARGDEVAELAAASLGDDLSGADLLARTEFRGGNRGGSLLVRSTAGFPDLAAAAANAFAGAVVEFSTLQERRRLNSAEERLAEELATTDPLSEEAAQLQERLDATAQLQALGPPLAEGREAELPPAPEPGRSVPRAAALGAAAGALLALAGLLAAEAYRRPVRGADRLSAMLGAAPVVAIAARPAELEDAVFGPGPLPAGAEGVQSLALAAGLLEGRPRGLVAVSSAMPEEGAGAVAFGLAAAAARGGRRALLLEADLRSPRLAQRLGIEAMPGLADYLTGRAAPREVLRAITLAGSQSGAGSLVCIPAGGAVGNPGELLSGSGFGRLLDQLGRAYDTVVVATSPLLPTVEGGLAARASGAAILCGVSGRSRRSEAEAAAAELRGATVLAGALLGARHSASGMRRLPPADPAPPRRQVSAKRESSRPGSAAPG